MACRCIDILESHYFIHSSLLAGNNGLNNPIRWPYVAELSGTLDSLPDFVRSGDGLIIMGDILKGSPDTLDRIFHYSVTLNLSILIFYQSKYLSVFPEGLLELANTNNIPVVLLDQHLIIYLVQERRFLYLILSMISVIRLPMIMIHVCTPAMVLWICCHVLWISTILQSFIAGKPGN